MTDDELSAEWVRVMTVRMEPENRMAQLAAVDAVVDELNARYESGRTKTLAVNPADAKKVADHLKSLVRQDDPGWFGPDKEIQA